LVRIIVAFTRLVGAAETDEVRCHRAMPRGRENGDHLSIEIRPGRLAVKHQHRCSIARPLVDIVNAEPTAAGVGNFDVVRNEAVTRQAFESIFGSA
jgi:hypothetical protein